MAHLRCVTFLKLDMFSKRNIIHLYRYLGLYSNNYDLSFKLRPSRKIHTSVLQNRLQNEYKVTFIRASGEHVTGKGKDGDSLLDVVVNNNLDFDGFGACEGTLTCSTCHCIFKKEDYDRLPEKPSDEEMDMLDLAYELTDTSRLGCQIQLTKDLDGLEVKIPATVNDVRS